MWCFVWILFVTIVCVKHIVQTGSTRERLIQRKRVLLPLIAYVIFPKKVVSYLQNKYVTPTTLIELCNVSYSAYGQDISYLFEIHVLVIITYKVQERLKIVFT